MTVAVVTGGIGSGKSEVCRIMKEMGVCAHYNADARAKALYVEHPALLAQIETELGERFTDGEGRFVASRLAARIFNDPAALETVERLLFPVLMEDFNAFLGTCEKDIVAFESATVLEKPQFEGFGDRVILVDAPFGTRLERASRRDGASEEAVLSRMRSQKLMNELSEGRQDPRIDYVISNTGSIDDLKERITEILNDKNFKK